MHVFLSLSVASTQRCRECKKVAILQRFMNFKLTAHGEKCALQNSNTAVPLCFLSLIRNVYAVWRSYLEGTVQVSQSRLNVCDNYKSQVSEPAKTVRLYKEQQLKKVSGDVDSRS